ncbi:transcription factor Ouib [Drosophila pseudoobscura]|uniref:Transcription factor Ouib n=1 Tax=Drosophila pseudoobscura pseudoobscura TaxID=46245 RepID=A0A6I8US01_DROPS|nr:transcription factor Ouib [Drosophila pseudoobscura]
MELVLDMVSVCRTCLQDGDELMVSIYERDQEKDHGGISLCEKIESFSGIQIKRTDDLPTRICLKCRAFLTLAHKFRQICQRSNDFLRDYVCKGVVMEPEAIPPSPQHPAEAEQYEQLEVEVLEEGMWSTDDLIEEEQPPDEVEETAIVLSVETVPAPQPVQANTNSTGKVYVCDMCGNSYPRKSTLDTHMRRHRNERPYECEICRMSFHVNYQLMRHIRKHTGARPYSCHYCQRSFADRTSLVKHERTHRNERPYACETCGKTFTYASVLKVHYKTHTGEKPHICRLCGKSFARNHNLVAHLQTQQHQNDPRTADYLNTLKAGNSTAVG